MHVARSSERLCNYIKEANSFSIKCTWRPAVATQIRCAFAYYGNNDSCTFYMMGYTHKHIYRFDYSSWHRRIQGNMELNLGTKWRAVSYSSRFTTNRAKVKLYKYQTVRKPCYKGSVGRACDRPDAPTVFTFSSFSCYTFCSPPPLNILPGCPQKVFFTILPTLTSLQSQATDLISAIIFICFYKSFSFSFVVIVH